MKRSRIRNSHYFVFCEFFYQRSQIHQEKKKFAGLQRRKTNKQTFVTKEEKVSNSHLGTDEVEQVADVDADVDGLGDDDVLVLPDDALHDLLRQGDALLAGELKLFKRILIGSGRGTAAE